MAPVRDEYVDEDDDDDESSRDESFHASGGDDNPNQVSSNRRRQSQQSKQQQQSQQQRKRPSHRDGNRPTVGGDPNNNDGIPRRWIYDRVHGTSRIEGIPLRRQQPPCFLCFPPPILKVCPWLLEENCVCQTGGRVGYCSSAAVAGDDEDGGVRATTLKWSMALNGAAFLVTIFAALALTETNESLLAVTAFSTTDLNPSPTSSSVTTSGSSSFPTVLLSLGLRALLIDNPNSSSSTTTSGGAATIISFDDFCVTDGMEQLMPMEDCNVCADASLYILIGILVALVAFLPTFATDVVRLYTNYDVNCQKMIAFIWGLTSLAGYGLVYYYYNQVCLASFYDGLVLYAADGTVIIDDPAIRTGAVQIDFVWTIGTGQICLLVGFGLKVSNVVFNCCVATPTITRDRQEQWEYERLSEKADAEAEEVRGGGINAGRNDDNDSSSSSSESSE